MTRARSLFSLVLLAACSFAAAPMWVFPTHWPVERLLKNTNAYLAEHPDSPETLYCLGRIHGLAFQFGTDSLGSYAPIPAAGEPSEVELPQLADQRWQEYLHSGNRAAGPDPARLGQAGREPAPESLKHLEAAVHALGRAIEGKPDDPQYHLGLAYVLDVGAHLAAHIGSPAVHGVPPIDANDPDSLRLAAGVASLGSEDEGAMDAILETLGATWLERSVPYLLLERASAGQEHQRRVAELLERWWKERAIRAYDRAYALAVEADLGLETQPMEGPRLGGLRQLVSFEAGLALKRLLPERAMSADESARLADVEKTLKALEDKPPSNWITPILLTLDGCATLQDLIEPEASVLFDLDGDGLEEGWPWPRPEAGWLVWDPDRTGRITSGQQLFGSASGWFFFSDGYRVLDALDNDRDRRLTGAELAGIAVWFDRDSDGVSDPGEVTPVEDLGIVALATEATETENASPANPCGVQMADGRVLATWDWVLRPVAATQL